MTATLTPGTGRSSDWDEFTSHVEGWGEKP